MTALARLIAAQIRLSGPMPLDEYMQLCLLHPQHGYYATRDPFGTKGDFTTAPEISQMFGELIGLALAQAWLDQGQPRSFTLAEIGPGRGTLMADILRVIKSVPGMLAAANVVLVEASAHLRKIQSARLEGAGASLRHVDHAADLPEAPLFLVANEFFDALPIKQFQSLPDGWAERLVTVDESGALAFALGVPMGGADHTPLNELREICPAAAPIMADIARRISAHGGAAIVIDYGTWLGKGDSFQALRNHQPEDPFAHPGEADLTGHVDFAALARAAQTEGVALSQMVTQGEWLQRLGIAQRAERLQAAGDLSAPAALHRLTASTEMGHLFKVLGLWPSHAPILAGFEHSRPHARDA